MDATQRLKKQGVHIVPTERIILVYDQDSGLFNAITGWAHKAFHPASYRCDLCRISFGLTGMLVPWRNYLERLPFQRRFLHRDEFRAAYPDLAHLELPTILLEAEGRCDILLHPDEIQTVVGVASLIARLEAKLSLRPDTIRRE